jgi:hypothetical protein
MAELKAVPSGYDSQALSSMLSYLANARRDHAKSPFMQNLKDKEMRDNKAEYLADADLTVRAQAADNDYTKQYNLAKMAQEAYDARAGRGVDMSRISGGALTPEIVSEDLNLGSQSGDSIAQVQQSMIDAQLLQPTAAAADVNKTYADTDQAKMNTLESGQRIAKSQSDMGQMTTNNIEDPNRVVTPNLDNMESIINAREQASGVINAARIGQSNKTTQPGIIGKDGKWQAVTKAQAEALSKQGVDITYGAVTDSIDTRVPRGGDTAITKARTVTKDVDGLAAYIAANPQLGYKGSGVDEKGAYAIKADGSKVHMKED